MRERRERSDRGGWRREGRGVRGERSERGGERVRGEYYTSKYFYWELR